MRWDRIDLLINRIKDDLIEQGYVTGPSVQPDQPLTLACVTRYFCDDISSTEPSHLQSGVIRTNCMDNLDRTNVVQSALAKWTLTQQLKAVAVLQESEDVENFDEFMNKFRNSMALLWVYWLKLIVLQCGQTTQILFRGHTVALARSRRTSLGLGKGLIWDFYRTGSIPLCVTSKTTISMVPDRYVFCRKQEMSHTFPTYRTPLTSSLAHGFLGRHLDWLDRC
jgi:hypothetical protein